MLIPFFSSTISQLFFFYSENLKKVCIKYQPYPMPRKINAFEQKIKPIVKFLSTNSFLISFVVFMIKNLRTSRHRMRLILDQLSRVPCSCGSEREKTFILFLKAIMGRFLKRLQQMRLLGPLKDDIRQRRLALMFARNLFGRQNAKESVRRKKSK